MKKLISTNPARNYEVLGSVDISSPEEIREKVLAAQKAKIVWIVAKEILDEWFATEFNEENLNEAYKPDEQ